MIKSFRHKGLKRLYDKGDKSRIKPDQIERIENILFVLDESQNPDDLNLPGYRLHPLKGDLKGFWSITVSSNWRIIFRYERGDIYDVDLTDYH